MLNPSDGEDAIFAASSGHGHRCIGASALLAFSDKLNAQGAWIDIVETSEIAEGLETPRIDLSIYGDHRSYDLPAADRKVLAARRLSEMMAIAANEGSTLGFDVWLDQDIVENCTPAAALAIRLAAGTGLRRGDLLDLRWSDVKSNRIDKMTNKSRGRTLLLCPLQGDAAVAMEELRAVRQAFIDGGKELTNHVVLTMHGKPWQPNSLTEAFAAAAQTAGVNKRLHDLRGTAVTKLRREGFTNTEIARYVGWEPSRVDKIIDRYVDGDRMAREAIERVEGAAGRA